MSGVAVAAAAVGVAGSVAGAVISSKASKKAGQTQSGAAQQAGGIDAAAAQKANDLQQSIYQPSFERYGTAYNQSLSRNADAYRAQIGRLNPYAQAGEGALNQLSGLMGTIKMPSIPGRSNLAGVSSQQWQDYNNQKAAHEANPTIPMPDVPNDISGVTAQEWQDYNKQKDQYTQAKAAGNYGDLNRYFTAQDYQNDPTSGGNAPPDLTKNFDEQAWLQGQGKTEADLTKNFDRTGYLANAGFNEADLARKFTANDFQVDPGYQFRLEQGNQGIEHSAAAQGGQLSGATLQALAKYNSNLGSQEYGNAFNRFQSTQQQAGNALGNAQGAFNINRQNLSGELGNAFNRFGINRNNAADVYGQAFNRWTGQRNDQFNRLYTLAGSGQQAAGNQAGYDQGFANSGQNADINYSSQTGSLGQDYANSVGRNLTGTAERQGGYLTQGANALAAGQVSSANAYNQGLQNAGNSLMQYAYLRQPTNYGYNNYGNGYNNSSGGGGGGRYGTLNTSFK